MVLLLLLIGMLQSPEVRLLPLDGAPQAGTLVRITGAEVVFSGSAGETTVPTRDLLAIEISNSSRSPKATEPVDIAATDGASFQQIRLHDGSVIEGHSVVRAAQQLTIRSSWLGTVEIASGLVRAVRLQNDAPQFSAQWNAYLLRETEKDLLVVPKSDGDGLDFLVGIVSAIGPEKISFLLDNEDIPVPTERVYGVVFASTPRKPIDRGIVLESAGGQRIIAGSVTFDGSGFQVKTAWGQDVTVASADLRRIDFSTGRLKYLSELDPIAEVFSGIDPEGSVFAGLIDDETARLMYGPRRDTTIDPAHRIRLRGRVFSKGLCIHSRTELRYALDRRYSTLETLVGVDDLVAFNQISQVALKITGDGDVLFEKVFVTNEEPVPVKLDVHNVATLSILVDYADNNSSCDWLDLADARLILAPEKK